MPGTIAFLLHRSRAPLGGLEAAFVGHVVGDVRGESVVGPVGPCRGLAAGGVAEDVAEIHPYLAAGLGRPAEHFQRDRHHGLETVGRLRIREADRVADPDGVERFLAGWRGEDDRPAGEAFHPGLEDDCHGLTLLPRHKDAKVARCGLLAVWIGGGIGGDLDVEQVAALEDPVRIGGLVNEVAGAGDVERDVEVVLVVGRAGCEAAGGVGGLAGPAIMPITLRMVLDIALSVDLPIIGLGGVSNASDIIEYIMAGATLVGVCTAGHLNGISRYKKIIEDLEKLLEELGASSLDDVRGLTLRRIEERKQRNQMAITEKIVPTVDDNLCNSCGKCEKACVVDAININETAYIDSERCIGCGLCVSVCPTKAINQKYYY